MQAPTRAKLQAERDKHKAAAGKRGGGAAASLTASYVSSSVPDLAAAQKEHGGGRLSQKDLLTLPATVEAGDGYAEQQANAEHVR